jgi:signal transduction histidine kinase
MNWIDTLAGRLFLLLVVGAVISALLALVVSDLEYRRRLIGVQSFAVAERVADFGAVMASPYVDDIEDEADDLSFALMDDREPLGSVDQPLTAAVQAALDRRGIPAVGLAREVSPYACGIDEDADDDDRRDRKGKGRGGGDAVQAEACRAVGLRIETQGAERTVWIIAAIPARPAPLGIERVGLAFLGVLLLAAAILAFIAARMATAPLRRLSEAAGELGRDIDRPPLKEEGSREVREAAGAFNTMQARLKATMRDRTRMLAAITHDLQTPLTRLRLRIEKVDDPDLRARLVADLAATQGLIREGLDLARAEDTPEPWAQLDLDAMIEALCEDAADAGQPVRFVGGCGLTLRARPQALKRCLANLIDNAVKYGDRAEVRCEPAGGGARIVVRDHGPGIPADRLERVFEPFERLEDSRSRDSGGTGLGLTIARRMAERTGAQLTMANQPNGGLEAVVNLPAVSANVRSK